MLGNYTVGNNMLRALYVRLGRQTGDRRTDGTTWWKPAQDASPRDPLSTEPGDIGAYADAEQVYTGYVFGDSCAGQRAMYEVERRVHWSEADADKDLPVCMCDPGYTNFRYTLYCEPA